MAFLKNSGEIPELLPLREVCEILRVHANTLRLWDKKGILPSVRFGQRKDRHYRKKDILSLLDNRERKLFSNGNTSIQDTQSLLNYTQKSLERVTRLQAITTALTSALTVKQVGSVIVKEIVSVLGTEFGVIVLHNTEKESIEVLSQIGYSASFIKRHYNIPLQKSVPLTDSIKTGNLVFIESTHDLHLRYPDVVKDSFACRSQAFVAVPLRVNGNVIGSIGIGFKHRRTFSKDDSTFLLLLASQSALALERARLYELQKKEQQEAVRTSTVLKGITTAVTQFLLPLESEETYQAIIKEAKQLFDVEYGSIFLWKHDQLQRVYASSPALYKIKPRKKGRTYKTFYTKQASISNIKLKHDPHPMLKRLHIKSVIYFPLMDDHETIGVMNLLSLRRESFTAKELEFASLFGVLASLTIKKTQLYAETKRSLDNQQLYLSLASHEVKTPLTALYGYLQLLEKKSVPLDPSLSLLIKKMTAETVRLKQLLNDFLGKKDIDPDSNTYIWKACNLQDIIQRVTPEFTFLYPTHVLTLKNMLTSKASVWGDFDKLLQVFTNILQNAGKYSPNNSEISVILKENLNSFVIKIKDNGNGIPQNDVKRVFKKFYRVPGETKPGMGLGLYLVKTILDNHKGSVDVTSTAHVGTTVTIRLPKHNDNRNTA